MLPRKRKTPQKYSGLAEFHHIPGRKQKFRRHATWDLPELVRAVGWAFRRDLPECRDFENPC
jgi:hypothetical protein